MHAEQDKSVTGKPIRLTVQTASWSDIRAALHQGVQDLKHRPGLSIFFGLVYALFGVALIAGLANFNQIWILVSVAVGFPLVAPFLAAGLYEMSRRRSNGTYAAKDIFLVIFNQQRRQFGWMSFLVLFIFWIWAYQVRIVLALTMHYRGSPSLEAFLDSLFNSAGGATFLIVGSIVGALLATALFSLTVVAMPLLLDKDVDVVTAMITSVKTVIQSPVVMLGWGAAIGAMTLLASIPAFAGVIILFPILGHTSWHLYQRLVQEV